MIKSLEGFAPYAPYLIPLTGLAFHELGHFLCGLAFGKVLRFRFRGLRLVWTMPGGLKAWQRALIAASGFGLEFALAPVLGWAYTGVSVLRFMAYAFVSTDGYNDFQFLCGHERR